MHSMFQYLLGALTRIRRIIFTRKIIGPNILLQANSHTPKSSLVQSSLSLQTPTSHQDAEGGEAKIWSGPRLERRPCKSIAALVLILIYLSLWIGVESPFGGNGSEFADPRKLVRLIESHTESTETADIEAERPFEQEDRVREGDCQGSLWVRVFWTYHISPSRGKTFW